MPRSHPVPRDLRHLEPPQPLLQILDLLENGGPGPHAFLLSREPMPLYPLLASGGWLHRSRRLADGVELVVYRSVRGGDAAGP